MDICKTTKIIRHINSETNNINKVKNVMYWWWKNMLTNKLEFLVRVNKIRFKPTNENLMYMTLINLCLYSLISESILTLIIIITTMKRYLWIVFILVNIVILDKDIFKDALERIRHTEIYKVLFMNIYN